MLPSVLSLLSHHTKPPYLNYAGITCSFSEVEIVELLTATTTASSTQHPTLLPPAATTTTEYHIVAIATLKSFV